MSASIEPIVIHKPEAGGSAEISVLPEQTYHLAFYMETANFERHDCDAVFAFDDGATLRLKDFFSAITDGDFTLELPDGVRISAQDMVEVFETDLRSFIPSGDNLASDTYQEPETADIFYPESGNAPSECRLDSLACRQSGLPQIEDVLNTSSSEIFHPESAPPQPTLKSLIGAPEPAPGSPADITTDNAQTDGENNLVLSMLGFVIL